MRQQKGLKAFMLAWAQPEQDRTRFRLSRDAFQPRGKLLQCAGFGEREAVLLVPWIAVLSNGG